MKAKRTKAEIGRGSRRKGKSYELNIAKKFSLWWTDGKDAFAWRRTVMSGGWDRRFAAGDLVAPTPNCEMYISIKKRQGWEFSQIWKDRGNSFIQQWIREARADMAESQRFIFVIFSKNRDKDYLVLPNFIWAEYRRDGVSDLAEEEPSLTFRNYEDETYYVIVSLGVAFKCLDPRKMERLGL